VLSFRTKRRGRWIAHCADWREIRYKNCPEQDSNTHPLQNIHEILRWRRDLTGIHSPVLWWRFLEPCCAWNQNTVDNCKVKFRNPLQMKLTFMPQLEWQRRRDLVGRFLLSPDSLSGGLSWKETPIGASSSYEFHQQRMLNAVGNWTAHHKGL
jgi:hypothetical protein